VVTDQVLAIEEASGYLEEGHAWRGTDSLASGTRNSVTVAQAAFRSVLSGPAGHLPFFLVADLAELVVNGYQTSFRQPPADDSVSTRNDLLLRRRYQQECLGTLLHLRTFHEVLEPLEEATEAAARHARERRLVTLVAERFGPHWPVKCLIPPGIFREYSPGARSPDPSADWSQRYSEDLTAFLASISRNQRWGDLLAPEDVFELRHWESLSTDHLRLGCRQISELSRRLEQVAQHVPSPVLHENDGAETSLFIDETHYPAGGLDGLVNRGSPENLVASELAYLDEEVSGVNLFELRHLEQELLYYVRDAGALLRRRRSIVCFIDLGADYERVPLGSSHQLSIICQALVLRLIAELHRIFSADAVRFRVHFVPGGGPRNQVATDEAALLSTLLADEIRRGLVEVEVGSPHLTGDSRWKTYAVILTTSDTRSQWQQRIRECLKSSLPLQNAAVLTPSNDQLADLAGELARGLARLLD